MRTLLKISVFTVIAASFVPSAAQSRPGQPPAEGKVNRRPTELAKPTPPPAVLPADGAIDDGEVIKVNTQLISVPVRVMDKRGRFIGGLGQENFKVFEDGVEQEVALFSNEHQPFTVALVLDMSYSTTFKIGEIQSAAIAFIEQLRPQDKVMVVSFAEEVYLLCEPTSDRKEIYRAIKSTKIATGTSLYEAVDSVMNRGFKGIDGRKAIILFSDGVDTTSRRSNDLRNLSDAMEMDALIYPIRYDTFADVQRMNSGTGGTRIPIPMPGQTPSPTPQPQTVQLPGIGSIPIPTSTGGGMPGARGTTAAEYEHAKEYLDQLATRTGGRLYEASTTTNLAQAYTMIASELREFYSIGYYPKADREPGKALKVKVKVDQEGLVVRTREGFLRRRETK